MIVMFHCRFLGGDSFLVISGDKIADFVPLAFRHVEFGFHCANDLSDPF